MTAEQEAKATSLGWHLDRSPSTEMRDGNWYRHGGTFEVKGEEAVLELVESTPCPDWGDESWRM